MRALAPLVLLLGPKAILLLTGWQDPHQVPIAAFFQHTTHVNYCAMLAQDSSWRVRLLRLLSPWLWVRGRVRVPTI